MSVGCAHGCGFIFFVGFSPCCMKRGRFKLLHVVTFIFQPVNWPHHTNKHKSKVRIVFLNDRRMLWLVIAYMLWCIHHTTYCIRLCYDSTPIFLSVSYGISWLTFSSLHMQMISIPLFDSALGSDWPILRPNPVTIFFSAKMNEIIKTQVFWKIF